MKYLILLLLLIPTFVDAQVVAEVAADFVEEPKPRPIGETVFPAFPIDKWEKPSIALDMALTDIEADPAIIIDTIFEITKDGKNFEFVVSSRTLGGIKNYGDKKPGPPLLNISQGVIPDGWVGQIRVVINTALTIGGKATGEEKK